MTCDGNPRFCPDRANCSRINKCWRLHTTEMDVYFLPAPQLPPKEARRRGSTMTMSQAQLDSYGESLFSKKEET